MKLLYLALDRGSHKYIPNAIHGIFFGRWIGMSSDARISHITDVLEESIPAEIRLYLPFLALEAQAHRKPSDQKTHHVTNYDLPNPTLLLDYIIIYLNFVDQTLIQKLSHKNTCPKMSQIFNSSPRFFPSRRLCFKKQEADDQIHNGHALWRSTFSNTFGRSDMEKLTIFLIQKLLCIKKKSLYQEKTQRTKNT